MNKLANYRKPIILLLCLIALGLTIYSLVMGIPRLSYTYDFEYNGYVISNAYGDSSEYYVKAEHNGKPVVGVSTRAFYKHSNLQRVIFEDSSKIKIIRRSAFSYCNNLEEIDISGVKYFEMSAFSYCDKLNNVKLNSISVGGSCFFKCFSLDNIELNNTNYIGSLAFSYTALESITLPNTISRIGSDAFYKCSKLTEVLVPESLSDNKYIIALGSIVKYC